MRHGDRGGRFCLIVEDNPPVRQLVAAVLLGAGYGVRLASTGAEALAALESRADEIGVVYLDLSLPDMTGEGVLAQLHARRPELPVVIATGRGDGEIGNEVRAMATAFLPKPFLPNELIDLMRRVVSGDEAHASVA